MTLFLLEDRDFKCFWMTIWNAGVSVITRSTFSSCNRHLKIKVVIINKNKYVMFARQRSEVLTNLLPNVAMARTATRYASSALVC